MPKNTGTVVKDPKCYGSYYKDATASGAVGVFGAPCTRAKGLCDHQFLGEYPQRKRLSVGVKYF